MTLSFDELIPSTSTDSLPDGWRLGTIGETGTYINGLAFKPSDWVGDGLPIIRIQNLTDREKPLNRTKRLVDPVYLVDNGDLLVSWSATLDAFVWDRERAVLNQHIFKVIPNERVVGRRFLYYLLKRAIAEMVATEHLHGSTMKHINRGPFLAHAVPIPPLSAQASIVEEIETELSRLEAGVNALQRVQANLKRYRAAVLKAACEGRLVPTEAAIARREGRGYETGAQLLERILAERRAKWQGRGRYQEPAPPDTAGLPELPDGWTRAFVEHVSVLVQYGTSAKTTADEVGVAILRMGNLQDGAIDLGSLKYLPESHKEFPDLLLRAGDLLFNRTNSPELVGKSAVYTGNPVPCSFASYLIRVRLAKGYEPVLLAMYLNSLYGRAWVKQVVSQQVGQANVNGTKLQALAIPVPSAAEQKRIVAEAERLLSVCDRIAAAVDANLRRAGRLRQAVLQRAFGGM